MRLSELHIRRQDDGTYAAVWGPYLLKSGFQPIFTMGGGPTRIGAFEALCRPMRDGVASSPAEFFPMVPASERFRVELQTRAVHVLNAPVILTDRELLFLNFDPSMFPTPSSVIVALDVLEETLAISDIDRKRIVCEVTEHKTSELNLISLVLQMRNRGFRVAVDDYGADSSDSERVRKLSPDIVKFDAIWITRLMDSGVPGVALLKDMVSTFKDRGIITLFEGIEHGWQLDLAVECGVEFVQGYALAKPQTVPMDFHHFRSKQDMTSPQSRETVPPKNEIYKKSGGIHTWEEEISLGIEEIGFKIPRLNTIKPVAAKKGETGLLSSLAAPKLTPASPVEPQPSRSSFTSSFGTRSGSFGQRR